jgi:hypothetical protein
VRQHRDDAATAFEGTATPAPPITPICPPSRQPPPRAPAIQGARESANKALTNRATLSSRGPSSTSSTRRPGCCSPALPSAFETFRRMSSGSTLG